MCAADQVFCCMKYPCRMFRFVRGASLVAGRTGRVLLVVYALREKSERVISQEIVKTGRLPCSSTAHVPNCSMLVDRSCVWIPGSQELKGKSAYRC